MSKNIDQIFIANPITSNASTDLMYFGQSPYGAGNDAAMTYANFSAQFGIPYTAAALTKTDDTNVTLTLGGTPATALLHATSLTLGWTGQLGLTRGGTNNSLTASNGGIVWSDASKLNILSGTVTANQVMLSGSNAAPSWSTAAYPATTTINQILYSSAANTISGITTANNGILVTSAGGIPSIGNTVGAGLTMPSITFNSTTGIVGTTTNNNAANGSVGQWLDSTLSSLINYTSTGTATNIQSLSLTAGDWDVYGYLLFSNSGGTTTSVTSSLSLTSGVESAISSTAQANTTGFTNIPNFSTHLVGRVSIASTTTVYLVSTATFTVAAQAFGAITARRAR